MLAAISYKHPLVDLDAGKKLRHRQCLVEDGTIGEQIILTEVSTYTTTSANNVLGFVAFNLSVKLGIKEGCPRLQEWLFPFLSV